MQEITKIDNSYFLAIRTAKNVMFFNPLSASIYLTDAKNKYYNCQFPAYMVYNSVHGRWN
jgi:hypothetical protein